MSQGDRVLLWNNYVVPHSTITKTRTACWDRFAQPDPLSRYAEPDFPTVWVVGFREGHQDWKSTLSERPNITRRATLAPSLRMTAVGLRGVKTWHFHTARLSS